MREVILSSMAGSQNRLLDIIMGFMYMISSGGLLDVSSEVQACRERHGSKTRQREWETSSITYDC
jgi:hypothetical protein